MRDSGTRENHAFHPFFRDNDVEKEKEILNKKCITTFLGKLSETS